MARHAPPQIANKQQRSILAQLMHAPSLSFNQLWDRSEDSNKLAYHLRRLIKLDLVEKSPVGLYRLTSNGKAICAFLESSGESTIMPTLAHITIIRKGKKLLWQERLKEPFRGYVSFVSGKIPFGSSLDAAVADDVRKQTGLVVTSVRNRGIEDIRTFEGKKLLYHHVLLIVEAKVKPGKIVPSKGRCNVWLSSKELEKFNRFPDIGFPEIVDPKISFVVAQGKRFMKNGVFVGSKIDRKQIF